MGLLDAGLSAAKQSAGEIISPLTNLFGAGTPAYVGPDFPDGFIIEELPAVGTPIKIALVGNQMPMVPFTYGGDQHIVREYYPGNREPSQQVFGARENAITIKGRLKAKKFGANPPTPNFRTVPAVIRDELDAMRVRGNMVKISLGEWQRYGHISNTTFMVKTLADIEYEITFEIISDKKPENAKFAKDVFETPTIPNLALMQAAAAFETARLKAPVGFSPTLFDVVNKGISAVASALSAVTQFVDNVVTVGEDTQKIANRALGLIRNAASSISEFKRRIGALDMYLNSRPDNAAILTWNEATKAKSARYLLEVQHATAAVPQLSDAQRAALQSTISGYSRSETSTAAALQRQSNKSIEEILLDMKKKFQQFSKYVPKGRHRVIEGDTLQKLSVKYYGSADNWNLIAQHNKLTSTELVRGAVLEIPNV